MWRIAVITVTPLISIKQTAANVIATSSTEQSIQAMTVPFRLHADPSWIAAGMAPPPTKTGRTTVIAHALAVFPVMTVRRRPLAPL